MEEWFKRRSTRTTSKIPTLSYSCDSARKAEQYFSPLNVVLNIIGSTLAHKGSPIAFGRDPYGAAIGHFIRQMFITAAH